MADKTLLKKLSAKTVMGNVKQVLAEAINGPLKKDGAKMELYRIYGIVHSFTVGEVNDKPFFKFNGQFGAINLHTGEEFASPAAFLPEPMTGMLVAALQESESKNLKGAIEFSVSVELQRDDASITGYAYVVRPILQVKDNDALAHLRDRTHAGLALPSAKKG